MPKNIKEIDMKKPPKKPNWFWKSIIIFLTFFFSGPFATRTKIRKHGNFNFKEPGIIISNHGSFVDMSNLSIAMFKPLFSSNTLESVCLKSPSSHRLEPSPTRPVNN